mgnify:FL=1
MLLFAANTLPAIGSHLPPGPDAVGATRIVYTRVLQYPAYAAPVLVPSVAVPFQPQWLSWLPTYPDRVYGKPVPQQPRAHAFVSFERFPLEGLSHWWRQTSEPVRRRPHVVQMDFMGPPLHVVIQPILLSEWWQPASEPVRRALQWIQAYPSLAEQDIYTPLPRLETWWWLQENPVRRRPNIEHIWQDFLPPLAATLPAPPPPPDLDEWWQPNPVMVFRFSPSYHLGQFFAWHTETGPDVVVTPTFRPLVDVTTVTWTDITWR